MEVHVERFGYKNLLQYFKFMKNVKIGMDVWWNNRRKESVEKKTIHRPYFLKYRYVIFTWTDFLNLSGFWRI